MCMEFSSTWSLIWFPTKHLLDGYPQLVVQEVAGQGDLDHHHAAGHQAGDEEHK